MTTKLTLTVTLTLTDTVKLISQTKLGGELLPERPNSVGLATPSFLVCIIKSVTSHATFPLNIACARGVGLEIKRSRVRSTPGHGVAV